jgi:uncharacterized protein YhaN
MRLKRLSIASFGKMRPGLEFKFKPGLNLIMAPNEAGKTTTLELITALLYGFGKRKGGVHPYEPWTNDSHEVGAELVYEIADQREFKLSRHLLKRGERLDLKDSKGSQVDLAGREPGELHLGLSKGVFHTVSRVQLDDLQAAFSGANQKDYKDTRQELMGLFFVEAATRGEVRNPVEVSEAWANEAASLYHTHGNRGRADKDLNKQLESAETSLAQAREREEQARRAQSELEGLTSQEADLRKNHGRAAEELDQIRIAMSRAEELARKTDLQAQIAEMSAKGLVEETIEQRVRDLDREAAAAEGRARKALKQSVTESAKIKEGDPAQDLTELSALESRLAILEAKEKEAQKQAEDLGRQWVSMETNWAMDVEALAGIAQDLPFRLHNLDQSTYQARDDSEKAQRDMQSLPTPPQWALGLGLGVVAMLIGIKGLIWSYFASWPWWAWACAGLLFTGGLIVGIKSLLGRSQTKARSAELERLNEYAELAASRAANLQAELDKASAGLSIKALSAGPARLAAAIAESINLLERSQKQADSITLLESEREEMARELAGYVEALTSTDWRQAIKNAKQACQAGVNARSEADRLAQQAEQEKISAEALRAEMSHLLAGAGLADMKALGQARERSRKVDQMRAALGEVEERLRKTPATEVFFHDLAECRAALEKAKILTQNLQAELNEISQRRGRLEQELNQLNASQSAAQAEAVCQDLRLQRWDLVRRHGVLLLVGACLEQAMQRFRLDAQPSLLQKASNLLSRTSAGAYEWLGSNIFDQKPGQDPDLTAKPGPGAMERQSEMLSRGTRDQLYLSLRLALAQEITAGQEPVPLLLDDPLVNFDDERLAASLKMLSELGSERQVVLFTCHRTQYEILRATGNCHLLELS